MRGGILDAIMQMFHKRPFRCRSCRRRFYSNEEELIETGEDSDEAADQHPF